MDTKSQNIDRDGFLQSTWQFGRTAGAQNDNIQPISIYDTVIVGAGITGITTGLLLQKAGRKCIIVEAGNIGFGTTGGTTSHLNTFFDTTYPEIESDFDAEAAKQVANSGKRAFSTIKDFIDEYNIDCDFEYKLGYLYSENEKQTKLLKEILESSRNAGVNAIEYEDNGVPVPYEMVICFPDQGQFHPLKYISRLAEEFTQLGGVLLEQTFVSETSLKNDLHEVNAGGTIIKGKNLVYATHVPPGISTFNFKCAPYRSYVLGVKLSNGAYPEGLSYDMQEPYHYFRTHEIEGEKYLIVGGEDHKTGHGDPDEAFRTLEEYTRKYFHVASVDFRWSSQYYVPVDGLPYIGANGSEESVYVATGFNGNGIIFGTLSAVIISDQILGVENPWSDLYSPSRIKPIAGFSEYVKENADAAYHFIADRFSADELDSLSELMPDQGMVAEINGKKVAVYKDPSGKVSALSPVCTHTGCIVKFNGTEKSWDCPCHGGRFDIYGKVITGPPQKDLEKIIIQ
jgi:glycine/D-amino acid oxidase-like deaminating enzyme/nitrite reductase/ring-hydroxylating ferredoxin subunit